MPRQTLTQVSPGVARTEKTASTSTTMPSDLEADPAGPRPLHRRVDQYAEQLDDQQDGGRVPSGAGEPASCPVLLAGRDDRLAGRASRWLRRISASRIRRRSSSVSGTTCGTVRGLPSASTATNTRYAVATCTCGPTASHRSAVIRTPISIELRPVQFTWAAEVHDVPDPDRDQEDHLVHRRGDRGTARVPCRDDAGHRVDQRHDHATVHGAEQVRLVLRRDVRQRQPGRRGRPRRRDAGHLGPFVHSGPGSVPAAQYRPSCPQVRIDRPERGRILVLSLSRRCP